MGQLFILQVCRDKIFVGDFDGVYQYQGDYGKVQVPGEKVHAECCSHNLHIFLLPHNHHTHLLVSDLCAMGRDQQLIGYSYENQLIKQLIIILL